MDAETQQVQSGPWRVSGSQFLHGLFSAVAGGVVLAVVAVINGVFNVPGFDVATVDWAVVGHNMINAAIVGAQGGFSGYIATKFLQDQNGKILGGWRNRSASGVGSAPGSGGGMKHYR